jgi:hypothetical protein
VAEEAKRLRLLVAVERRADEIAETRLLMEGEHGLTPDRLRNTAFPFECVLLEHLNRGRPPSRVAYQLPARCYEARHCLRFAGPPATTVKDSP